LCISARPGILCDESYSITELDEEDATMTTANKFDAQGTGLTTLASGNPDRPYDEISLSGKAFWSTTMDEREKSFAVLRKERPITWQPPFEENLVPVEDDYGYWAITTHRHLVEVTRRPDDFLSGPGIVADNVPAELLEAAQSIIAMDAPRHTKLRRLTRSGATPPSASTT